MIVMVSSVGELRSVKCYKRGHLSQWMFNVRVVMKSFIVGKKKDIGQKIMHVLGR